MSDIINAAPLPPNIREGGTFDGRGTPRKRQENASTGVGAATMRALSARFLAFYFRAPMKAFFRSRVDYMGYARAINPAVQAGEKWSWRMTSPALLASAVKQHGWSFIPNQILPPLMANTLIGAVLYTAYLQTLGLFHEPAMRATKRIEPLPPPSATFAAGFIAGSLQSVVAAPLDALQVRFQSREFVAGKYRNMWQYANMKIREIGTRGIFAGWTLSLLRDSFGNAAFFGVFEYVKGQCFYSFVSNLYGHWGNLTGFQKDVIQAQQRDGKAAGSPVIRPHYLLEPTFLALAGVAASVVQAAILHPVSRIQEIHYGRLEWIDSQTRDTEKFSRQGALRLYASAYRKTFKECLAIARRECGTGLQGIRRWLFKDFWLRTVTQVPSTAAGLIVFEVIRRRYGDNSDVVRINKDGYDILLV
ncbi:mitochondrial carrier protein [Teratosphaeria destructans]|uniref:Mitochondrial carrier protein n=1 Tax=Teratosphaeria destructans TaxID=418781 RepID=A0A9W7W180_9PEZI|nr:mitochondrial carrier protein [Teratosphaeria destructans]